MSYLRLLIVCLSLVWCVSETALNAAVVLPIEITGLDGTVESITVSAAAGSTATALWLRVHGLTYQEKASVQVNSGAWIALRNDTAGLTVEADAAGYGGIGGVWQTLPIRIVFPAGVAVNGSNTIRFRFNQSNGVSSGWRVLDVNLLSSNSSRLIAANAFTQDNPATWQPPRNTTADIAAGDALWSGAQLISRPGGPAIKATCSLCHDPEARDLQYFSYSNKMIISRAVFHGLSTTQGEQIASYVRSNSIKRVGRPWNPPFQPGAGLDAKPADEWAAGAGIDAVVTDEHQILAALPGQGTDLNAHIDANQRIRPYNRREMPMAIQFMDWNHWLPTTHPIDSVSESAWNSSFNKTRYDAIRSGLLGQRGMTKDQYIRAQMRGEIDEWGGPEANAGLGNLEDSTQGAETQEHYRRIHDILLNNAVRMW